MTDHPIDVAALRQLHERIVDVAENPQDTDAGAFMIRCVMQVMQDLPALLDEVERLRDPTRLTDMDRAFDRMKYATDEIEALQAEIERLRAIRDVAERLHRAMTARGQIVNLTGLLVDLRGALDAVKENPDG